jgi:two-component system chemotaxis sensor kinase CheA
VDLTEFLSEFQLEAGEKLDLIASQLLRLERDSSDLQPVREMFLAAHTVKGGAAMMRLTEVETLAHAVEDLLSAIRDQQRPMDAAAADLLFQAIDRLRALVADASTASVGIDPDESLLAFAAQLRSGPRADVPHGPARALVVDDSATVRELHRMLLEDAGYVVETFADGHAAVARALAERADLVVAGVQSDALSGFELCSALRHSDVAVVLMSADAGDELVRRATAAGARALVRKGSLRDSELARFLASNAR